MHSQPLLLRHSSAATSPRRSMSAHQACQTSQALQPFQQLPFRLSPSPTTSASSQVLPQPRAISTFRQKLMVSTEPLPLCVPRSTPSEAVRPLRWKPGKCSILSRAPQLRQASRITSRSSPRRAFLLCQARLLIRLVKLLLWILRPPGMK